ncbi:MAG: RDD family protein [Candidatus Omnitrophica bacterium]|nr:RDD family protein [Candidatus Omnitrophota bacterium]
MTVDEQVKGYLSETDKKKFTITIGILGAAFLILQFVLPFVFMFVFMFGSAFTTLQSFEAFKPDKAAIYKDQLWFLSETESFRPKPGNTTKLYSWDQASPEPVPAIDIAANNPWLFADKDKLWIISPSYLAYIENDELIELELDRNLGNISNPFLYKGSPAVIEFLPSEIVVKALINNTWQRQANLTLWNSSQFDYLAKNIRVITDDNTIHFFYESSGSLFYINKPISSRNFDVVDWEPVLETDNCWFTFLWEGEPQVFYADYAKRKINGARLQGKKLEDFFSFDSFAVSEIGVYPLAGSDGFIMLYSSYPGSVRIIKVSASEIANDFRFGKGFPFPKGFTFIMFIPQILSLLVPFILAFIFTALMRKHRTEEFYFQDKHAFYAPLFKRALAQLIDGFILVFPLGLGWSMAMVPLFDMDKFADPSQLFMFSGFTIMALGIIWAIGGLFLFSYLEGKWGITPGKKILCIRVLGIDLQPCGFGRALVRNLLKFIDGFFSFMVGVLIVALSENWQRVGDMAARTIVVDTKRRFIP